MIYRLMTTNNFSQHTTDTQYLSRVIKKDESRLHQRYHNKTKLNWSQIVSKSKPHQSLKRLTTHHHHHGARWDDRRMEENKRRQWRDIYVALVFRWRLTYFKYILWLLVTQTFAMSFIFRRKKRSQWTQLRLLSMLLYFLFERQFKQRQAVIEFLQRDADDDDDDHENGTQRVKRKRCASCGELRYSFFISFFGHFLSWPRERHIKEEKQSTEQALKITLIVVN